VLILEELYSSCLWRIGQRHIPDTKELLLVDLTALILGNAPNGLVNAIRIVIDGNEHASGLVRFSQSCNIHVARKKRKRTSPEP
jgi:hypothetical protein